MQALHKKTIKICITDPLCGNMPITGGFPYKGSVMRNVPMSRQQHEAGNVRFTVYPKKYAHGFVVLCFVVVMQSFIMNSHEVFIHIHQGCFAGTGSIVRLPQCQWSKPDGYGIISQCITTTKHSKPKTVCIFLGIYYRSKFARWYEHKDSELLMMKIGVTSTHYDRIMMARIWYKVYLVSYIQRRTVQLSWRSLLYPYIIVYMINPD